MSPISMISSAISPLWGAAALQRISSSRNSAATSLCACIRPHIALSASRTTPALRAAAAIAFQALLPPLPPSPWRLASTAASAIGSSCADEPQGPLYRVVNFYHLVEVSDPKAEVERHRRFLDDNSLILTGRIYITHQGINAQYSGTEADAFRYASWVSSQPGFEDLSFSADPASAQAFPRLRLKTRYNLVSLSGGHSHLPVTDPSLRATKVSPAEWRRMLEEGAPTAPGGGLDKLSKAVVLDVRNGYEWDVGHFNGAERPNEVEFRETPTGDDEVPVPLEGLDRSAPVMMYCTGGIRCDIYSAALRRRGFTNLYTLEGGIANYLRTEGGDHWEGSLFVFDKRMVLPGDLTGKAERKLEAAAPCSLCGAPNPILPQLNCANIDCNKLFLACDTCRERLKGRTWQRVALAPPLKVPRRPLPKTCCLQGCCCDACIAPPRLLRPLKEGGYYGSWTEYNDGGETESAMAAGRGEGRKRRRARKLMERREAARAKQASRKQMARAAMASAALSSSEDGAGAMH